MQPWRHESMFADYIAEHTPMPSKSLMNPISSPISQEARRDHLQTLADLQNALHDLQPYLRREDQEGKWVEQLKSYWHERLVG